MSSVRFLVLSTGSRGNCAWLGTPHASILFDCGIPLKYVTGGLREHGIDPAQLDALVITHTHSDHISGVGVLLRKYQLKVYCPRAHVNQLRAIAPPYTEVVPLDSDEGFVHRDLDILPVQVSHDCSPTYMYKVYAPGARIGLLTDLGIPALDHTAVFGDCDCLLLEANHCPRMLAAGRYPEVLKRRIAGNHGHLSNEQSVIFATGLAHMPQRLLLGHLSDDNNRPELASASFSRIETGFIPHTVIPQRTMGPLVEF
ncbi:MBL fold metallo-hydrolase [bacterium]|nr:MBL fold metallo-hydrolase [bacterium]